MVRRGEHSACCEWKGEDEVDEWIEDHVVDDAIEAFQLVFVFAEYIGLFRSASQVEEHEAI